jgi:D-methionine transport system permease protein
MNLTTELINSTLTTCYMVGAASAICFLLGLPLGVYLFLGNHNLFSVNRWLHKIVSYINNGARSLPFIILMIAVIPLTRLLVGTSIGTTATIVPLSLAAIPFFARITQSALQAVPVGLIEAGLVMGATPFQIITKILLAESWPSLIRGFTLTIIALIGYSAMAGAIGGGGLGDFAIRYGYQRFNTEIMVITIILLIAIVQTLQSCGDALAKKFTR